MENSIPCVLHTSCTASSQNGVFPASNQSLISRETLFHCILYIRTSMIHPMKRVSASVTPPLQTTASRLTASYYSSYVARSSPPSLSPNSVTPSLISKLYLSLWESPEVSERMWSINLDASFSGEYQTVGGQSGRPSE
jgi:hypothetical protein